VAPGLLTEKPLAIALAPNCDLDDAELAGLVASRIHKVNSFSQSVPNETSLWVA
jgi:hypothetical protein